MTPKPMRLATAALLATIAACTSAAPAATRTAPQRSTPNPEDIAAMAKAKADSAQYPYTEADIHFMSGMISHHAQAIVMAKLAPTHGASTSVRTLCDRIINAQGDEIRLMSQWLRDRRLPVPEPDPRGMKMDMGGMEHTMLMPGMLTDEQMRQLGAARGADFDRLFLTGMIQHHQGAVTMVKELFDTYGAGQDQMIYKFASDVQVDQTTEITRMRQMLAYLVMNGHAP